jgi:glutamate racemase
MMLGLYDSGLGGLTVLSALREAGVTSDIVYFADQAHAPYGDRSDADLAALLADNFAYLAGERIGGLVMACNTSCAVASRLGWPAAGFPVLDLIENAAQALEPLGFERIAVIATTATVRSGAYGAAIRRRQPGAHVFEIAAPALVPLVESGQAGSHAAERAVRDVVAGLPPVDAVVYGCTHYPLLETEFAAALPRRVVRFDPARAQADATLAGVAAGRFANGAGVTRYLTSGNLAAFERNVRALTGDYTGVVAPAPLAV